MFYHLSHKVELYWVIFACLVQAHCREKPAELQPKRIKTFSCQKKNTLFVVFCTLHRYSQLFTTQLLVPFPYYSCSSHTVDNNVGFPAVQRVIKVFPAQFSLENGSCCNGLFTEIRKASCELSITVRYNTACGPNISSISEAVVTKCFQNCFASFHHVWRKCVHVSYVKISHVFM